MNARLLLATLASGALACAMLGAVSAPATLEGTGWTLASVGAERVPIAKTQNEPYIALGASPGRVEGSGGCNRLTATYTLEGPALVFSPIAATRMACADGMEVEAALSNALEHTERYRVEGNQLELFDGAGVLLATFEAGNAR